MSSTRPDDATEPGGARDDGPIIAATEAWLVGAVIGLGLCPFAKPVHAARRIRYRVSDAATAAALLDDLMYELHFLATVDPDAIETTLIIHPDVLGEFLAYNAFLATANAAIVAQDLEGVIQIASFHPAYQFADAASDDIGNFTNRSPYPMLQLLREASVERALAAHPDPTRIYENNIATLRRLGPEGWARLGLPAAGKK